MQRSSKNSRLGPQSFAGSFVSDRSEGQKSLASIASMMSEKVLHPTAACLLSASAHSCMPSVSMMSEKVLHFIISDTVVIIFMLITASRKQSIHQLSKH